MKTTQLTVLPVIEHECRGSKRRKVVGLASESPTLCLAFLSSSPNPNLDVP